MPEFLSRKSHIAPYIIIAIGNLIPLYGVMFWDWILFDIFYLYWIENVLIGIAVLVRMLMVAGAWGLITVFSTLFKAAFFVLHYGMFCMGHGMIIFELFYAGPEDTNQAPELVLTLPLLHYETGFFIALAGIVLVEIIQAFRAIYKDRKEARLPESIMFSPYGRIIVLHIAILFGGLTAAALGSPVWALAILIILKTIYDALGYRGFNFEDKKGDNDKAVE